MIDIYEECLRLLTAGEAVVIATVFEAKGSAPRTAGAKMIVRADASIKGTIGGGRLEHDAIMAACNLFHTKNSSIYAFDLTGTDVAGMDMICGGRGEVWLHYLDNQIENNQTVCRATIELLKEQKKGWLITELTATLPSQDRQYALLCGDESMAGYLHIDREKINILLTASETCGVYTETIGSMRFLVEAIRPAHSVFVFGAGHVSMQVVPLCQNVGFRTIVLDDRAEYANRDRFPSAAEVVVLESFESWRDLLIRDDSFIVILTRGHIFDKKTLTQALQTPAAYIGMIGSRRKRDKIYQALLDEGFTQQDIDRVHSPIGINIAAESPAELAVSIVGELIQVRAGLGKAR